MRYLVILSLLFLVSCKGDESATGGAGASCSATKSEASSWVSVNSGTLYDFRGTSSGLTYTISFVNDGVCNPADGEYLLEYNSSDLKIYFAPCDMSTIVSADYEINCQNELRIYNYSDGSADDLLR